MHEEYIGDRLKKFLDKTGVNRTEIAKAIKVSEGTLRSWENGTGKGTFIKQKRLMDYLDEKESIRSESQVADVEATYNTQFSRSLMVRIPVNGTGRPLPYEYPDTAAGTVQQLNDKFELIAYRIEAPVFIKILGLVVMIGRSMEPTYKDKQKIGIARIDDITRLDWGECYFVIDNNFSGTVKRVYEGTSGLQLISDNTDLKPGSSNQMLYPPIEIAWEKIRAIFKVIDLL